MRVTSSVTHNLPWMRVNPQKLASSELAFGCPVISARKGLYGVPCSHLRIGDPPTLTVMWEVRPL